MPVLALFWVHLLIAASEPAKREHSKNFLSETISNIVTCFSMKKKVGMKIYLDPKLKLPESLDEGHSLNIADGAAQLYDAHLWFDVAFDRLLCNSLDPFLNGIRYVRDNCVSRKEERTHSVIVHF
jgi:hypothetical protein